MSFKGFLFLSSGRHFVQPSGAILVILVEGHLVEYFCANILKSGHWPRMRCRLKIFYFSALAAILFSGAEPLWPSWIFDWHNFSLFQSRSHPVATEQVSAQSDLRFEKRCQKIDFQDGGCGGHLGFFYRLI